MNYIHEYDKLSVNRFILNRPISELSMNDTNYEQISHKSGGFKVVLEFPKQAPPETEPTNQDVKELLSGALKKCIERYQR